MSDNNNDTSEITNVINLNATKRPSIHLEHLENIEENSLVHIENASQSHEATKTSTNIHENIAIGNVLVTNSRSGQMNGHLVTLHHDPVASTTESYETIEYVSSPIMNLQEDHQNKFNEGLVNVNNVDFAELSENSIKTSSGSPLELYFDAQSHTISPYLLRHEHQAPKAQLLVRAYTDFIQPLEQQHLNSNQNGHLLHSTEHPENLVTEVIEENFVPIPIELNDLRKGNKYDSLKRQVTNTPHKSLSNFHLNANTIAVQVEEDHEQNSSINIPVHQQLPLKYQHIHKQYGHQTRQIEINYPKDDLINQNLGSQLIHHAKDAQGIVVSQKLGSYSTGTDITNVDRENLIKPEGLLLPNEKVNLSGPIPLVSRSGRTIKRRPEYQEYVNQNIKEELEFQDICSGTILDIVKLKGEYVADSRHTNFLDEEEVLIPTDMHLLEDDDSNDEDEDPSENYTSDGRRCLPHKKRIPKKLKNAKKHVKCYKCFDCGEEFALQNLFNLHKQTRHNTVPKHKPFNCEICNKGYETQIKFFEHLKSHYEPNKKFKCEVCGGEFVSAEFLQEHSVVHTRVHFKCIICHKTFRKESMLEVHMKACHLEDESGNNNLINNPYPCSCCSIRFKTQHTLDCHVQAEHSDNLPELNCEDCYQVFKSKAKLLSHRKADHKEEVPLSRGTPKKKLKSGKGQKESLACKLCPRTFAHKNSLTYHIRGHTGERPHQCEQCGKAFYAASALKVHLRLHTGEKPFKCNSCGKFFRQWGDLKYHTTSVHSDKRQFQCEFCGKDFKRKYCLVVHRRIHTGEKKYKCEFCQKSFRASSYLQNHIRIHTGERPYPCPDCGKPFRVRSDMKRHRHTHLRDGTHSGNSNATSSANSAGNVGSTHITTIASVVHANSSSTPVSTTIVTAAGNSRQMRTIDHHSQGQQVQVPLQILQGSVTSNQLGQLIITDSSVIGEQNHPIRFMVSSLPQQQAVNLRNPPPPAHKNSQASTASLSGTTTISSGSSSGAMTSDVIILDDSTKQPINLNILPRLLSSSGSSSSNHSAIVSGEEYEIIQSDSRSSIEIRDDEQVCVWSGVQVFQE